VPGAGEPSRTREKKLQQQARIAATAPEPRVRIATGIASLFVMSASAMFIPFDDVLEFSLYDETDAERVVGHLAAGLDRDAHRVFYTVYARKSENPFDECIGQCEIPSGHPLFEAMVKLSASMMLKYRVDDAFKGFDKAYAEL
jgi:hypothetical protein